MQYKRKPWAHQETSFKRVTENNLNEFGLFFEVGTGKTGAAIAIMRHWYEKHEKVLRTIIFSPPITLSNWKNEFSINSDIPQDKIIILQGHNEARLKLFNENKDKDCIFITNYEALLMPKLHMALLEWNPQVVVGDELHKIKDHTSRRAKLIFPLADCAYYRLGLTGTPILNSYMDLFSQFRFLDKGETFGKNFFSFRSKFFYDKNAGMMAGNYFPDWRPKPNIAVELEKLINTKTMTVKKKDCLSLPPVVRQTFRSGMGRDQKRMYDQMKKDFISYVTEDTAAIATLAITKALRLMQIVSGFVKLDDGTVHRFPESPKEKQLEELLSELCPQNKVLIWAVFHENYLTIKKVCERLKLKYVEVTGEVTGKNAKQDAINQFKTDPETVVFIGHPSSAGIGINLVEARASIVYSRNFSLEQKIQADGRNDRGGSEIHESILQYDLITEGSIEEEVLLSLENKQAISDSVIKKALGL